MALDRDLAGFVRQHVTSVWMLEMLLLMRAQPDRAWTVAELVRELRGSTWLVTTNLGRLQRSGLVVDDDGRFRFAPAGEVLRGLCDEIAEAYRERPVTVINLIAAPDDPIRGLADAFRFKGGDR